MKNQLSDNFTESPEEKGHFQKLELDQMVDVATGGKGFTSNIREACQRLNDAGYRLVREVA